MYDALLQNGNWCDSPSFYLGLEASFPITLRCAYYNLQVSRAYIALDTAKEVVASLFQRLILLVVHGQVQRLLLL